MWEVNTINPYSLNYKLKLQYLIHFQGGKLKEMLSGMTSVLMPNEVIEDRKKKLVEYLFANWNQHRLYAASFFTCEILNFVNVIAQIFLLDTFLGGEFTTYGAKVIQESEIDPEERTDPMSRVSHYPVFILLSVF